MNRFPPTRPPVFTVAEDSSTWSSLSDALRHALRLPSAETARVSTDGEGWDRADGQWVNDARRSEHYTDISTWYPFDGEPIGYQPDPLINHHATFAEADRSGARNGCMNGIARVEVYAPDGVLQCLWDKAATETYLDSEPWWVEEETGETLHDTIRLASRWQRLGREADAWYRADAERIRVKMRAEHAANRVAAVECLRAKGPGNQ